MVKVASQFNSTSKLNGSGRENMNCVGREKSSVDVKKLCYVMSCYVMLCYAMLCYVMI